MTAKTTTAKISVNETIAALVEQIAVQEKNIKELQICANNLQNKLNVVVSCSKERKDSVTQEDVNSIVTRQTEVIKTELNVLLQRQKEQETGLNKTLSASIKTVTSDVIRQLPRTKNEHKNHYAAGIFIGGILLVIANIFAVTSYILKDLNYQELSQARCAAYIYRQYNKVDSAIMATEHPATVPLLQKYRHAAQYVGADSVIRIIQQQQQKQREENAVELKWEGRSLRE